MNNKSKKFAGFTLIELLTTIVIIGVLATTSVATFKGHFEKARIARALHFASEMDHKLKAETIKNELTILADCALNKSTNESEIKCLNGFSLHRPNGNINSNDFIEDAPIDGEMSYNIYNEDRLTTGTFPMNLKDSITMSAWFKNNGTVSFYQTNGMQVVLQILKKGGGQENPKDTAYLRIKGPNSDYLYLLSGDIKNIEKWHHITGSYNDNTKVASLYLNGELLKTNKLPNVNYFKTGSTESVIDIDVNSVFGDQMDNYLVNEIKVYPGTIEQYKTNVPDAIEIYNGQQE